MIKTSEDLQAVVSELSEEKQIEFSGVNRTMDSSEFNGIMYQIESDLNDLYEKIRLLNDMAEYTRSYVIKNVEERRAKFVEKLKVIEQLTDSYRDKSYVTHLVPFIANQTQVRNREGKVVEPLALNSGRLEMNGTTAAKADIESMFLSTADGCCTSTADLMAKGRPCRSTYLVDEPIVGGIKESYEVRFKLPLKINYIDIDSTNCDIENIQVLNKAGSPIRVDLASSFIKETEVEGLKFDTVSKDYQNALLDSNKSNTKTLTVRTGEHRDNKSMFKEDEKTLSDLEKLSQMSIYRGNYATWLEGAEAVEKKNALSQATTVKGYSSRTELRDFDNSAIALPDGSMLEPFSDTGYRYTPSGNVYAEDLVAAGGYETEKTPAFTKEATRAAKNGFKYTFGLDAIKVQQKAMYKECGYQSETISLGECSYIELSADENGSNPVEYYIIDGTKEVPILPVEKTKVVHEPLVYQLGTRFAVDPDSDVKIYQDGVETNLLLSDADSFDYAGHSYTVSYTPIDAHKYFPKNKEVQVKIIQKKSELPTTINTVSIRKHGGEMYWTILA